MRNSPKPPHKAVISAAVGSIATLAALLTLWTGVLNPWEAETRDLMVRLSADAQRASDDIVLILLDQNSLDWMQENNGLGWPWPRETYSVVSDFCSRAGAKALFFDVLYTEPSRYGVGDDLAFARALQSNGHVGLAVFAGRETGKDSADAVDLPSAFHPIEQQKGSIPGSDFGPDYPRAATPLPELVDTAATVCNVNFAPEPDGVYRRLPVFARFGDTLLPSPGLGIFAAADPDAEFVISVTSSSYHIRSTGTNITIPTDTDGKALLRYHGPTGTYTSYSAAAIIQSELRLRYGEEPTIQPSALKDRWVLFGFSAPGLMDLRSTPFSPVQPGVEIHATMLDNILAQDFMTAAPTWVAVLFIILVCCSAAPAGVYATRLRTALPVALFFLAGPAGLVFVLLDHGHVLPLLPVEVGAASALFISLGINFAFEGRQKRFIKSAFAQYLSPAVIDELLHDPSRLKLGGEKRTLSIFFSDLQGFTSISEGLEPEELTALLNDYLTAMTDIILEHGGTIDKYEGDAIIAFWNAPTDQPDHAARAVQAALECQTELARLRPDFQQRCGKEVHMRIGLNTGPAVVGNLGSKRRFDYSMLGDAVNLAARLEGINKYFGTYTLVSHAVREAAGDICAFREISRVVVVGRKEPVTVYEPMSFEEAAIREAALQSFSKGLKQFYDGQFRRAAEAFAATAQNDPAAAAYAAECRKIAAAPPQTWEGVWKAASK